MASAIDRRRIIIGLLVIVISATLVWFGDGLNPIWPLMWIAPLPVLLIAAWPAGQVAGIAFLSWFVGFFTYYHYLHRMQFPWLPVFLVEALLFVLSVLLYRALLLRRSPWMAMLAFPSIWVAFEYLVSFAPSTGTAGSLSYTQLRFLPVLQLASITGPWGITFAVLLFSSTLAVALHVRRSAPRQAGHIAIAGLGAIAVVLVYGSLRLAGPAVQQPVKAGLIVSDLPANESVAAAGPDATRLFRDYAAQAQKLAGQGAAVIVMPEKVAVVADSNPREADAAFQPIADQSGVTLVVGVLRDAPPHRYNRALVYRPNLPPVTYDKQHMLPPFESPLTPGSSLTLLSGPRGTWGVAICKDLDFADPARSYGRSGAGLLLVPAWDFNIDRVWHGHIAIMRGVEDGFSIVRAAKHGYLTVSDDRGRIVAEARSDSAPFATLLASVPTAHHATIYLRLGDWFAWLALVLLVISLARLTLQRKS
ncbi:MAG TPA: nitrilase-related carbon-nitrogen hydrolase [Terracidiphilus sp.]|nr:nitrilase-related carbon-nitrogen hydrolase [Terracidiphilus sp.]